MLNSELGFGFKSIGRLAKKAAKGAYKYSGTGLIVKGNIAFAKLSAKLALLPLLLLKKAVTTIGRVLCKAPPQLLSLAATQAGVDPAFIPLFCKAVQVDKWNMAAIKSMLPPALKLASKMAASGMFPPVVPALAILKRIPGMGKFLGAELGRGYRQNHGRYVVLDGYGRASDLRNPALRPAVDGMEILALADHLGLLEESDAAAMGLGDSDREMLQGVLQESLGAADTDSTRSTIALVGLTAIAGIGIYLVVRNPRNR